MPSLLVTTREGDRHDLSISENKTVMEVIRDAGIDELLSLCGGSCSCATCHVFLDPESFATVDAMGEDENDLLDSSAHRTEYSRLSCQIWIRADSSDIAVEIAPED